MTDTTILSDQTRAEIDNWVAKFPADRKLSAVIPALHIAQDAHDGWLSEEVMEAVAKYLELPKIAVFEVATFYSMFELSPVGQHKLCVCTNISCMLNGSEEIINHCKKRFGIGVGETTVDGKFTLKSVECLGACVNAPVMQLGKQYYEHLTPEKIDEILAGLES